MFNQYYNNTYGEIVKLVRDECDGWSTTDISRGSGCSWGTCHKFLKRETKFPQLRTVVRIARCFNIDISFKRARKARLKLKVA